MVHSTYLRIPRPHMGIFLSKVIIFPPSRQLYLTLAFGRQYTRASAPIEAERLDIFDSGYTGKIFLYIFCGILDAMWQTTAYWIMGAMSNDPAKLAYFAGFCACFHLSL